MGANDKILTHVGLLDSTGNITATAQNAFILDVCNLLSNGNEDGLGMRPNILSLAKVKIPPTDPTPAILNPLSGKAEQFFYFSKDFTAPIQVAILTDRNKCPLYYDFFISNVYQTIANAFDVPGNCLQTPLLFDPSIPFPDVKLPSPIKLPIPITIDYLIDLGISIKPPDFPPSLPFALPSFPSIPSLPSLPDIFIPGIGFIYEIILPQLLAKLPELFFNLDFILTVVIPKLPLLPFEPLSVMFSLLLNVFIDLLKLVQIPLMPKVLSATITVLLKNIVAMILTDLVGLVIGSGEIIKAIATLLGLV